MQFIYLFILQVASIHLSLYINIDFVLSIYRQHNFIAATPGVNVLRQLALIFEFIRN